MMGLSVRINGRHYSRANVKRSHYDRSTGYIHMTFHDGVTARIDCAGILVESSQHHTDGK